MTFLYKNPYIDVKINPEVNNFNFNTGILGIVGEAQFDGISVVESANLVGTTPYTLQKPTVNVTNIVVTSVIDGTVYTDTTDYQITTSALFTTIERVAGGNIPDGTTVEIAYSYYPENYNTVNIISDYNYARSIYGDPFDANGVVISPLTLSIRKAFENGATTVYTKNVEKAASVATQQEWTDAFTQIIGEGNLRYITISSGDEVTIKTLLDQLQIAAANRTYVRAFVGLDGSVATISHQQKKDFSVALNSERISLVDKSYGLVDSASVTAPSKVGGQYLANALAGFMSTLDAAQPAIQKPIYGFRDIEVDGNENDLAGSGMTVITKKNGYLSVVEVINTFQSSLENAQWIRLGQIDNLKAEIENRFLELGILGSKYTQQKPAQAANQLQMLIKELVAENMLYSLVGNVVASDSDRDKGVIKLHAIVQLITPVRGVEVNITISVRNNGVDINIV